MVKSDVILVERALEEAVEGEAGEETVGGEERVEEALTPAGLEPSEAKAQESADCLHPAFRDQYNEI